MPLISVAMRKQFTFHDVDEIFSNVYTYEPPDTEETTLTSIVALLANAEAAVHADIMTFLEARVWTSGGTPAENQTLAMIQPTVIGGSAVHEPAMHREAIYMVDWKTARRNVLDRPVTLRKYIHACSRLGGGAPTGPDDYIAGTTFLPAVGGPRSAMAQYGDEVQRLEFSSGSAGSYSLPLMSTSGRTSIDGSTASGDFCRIHELKY